jgi:hypothetical protein
MRKISDGRWPENLQPLFGLCRQFVGQPFQQISEWNDIASEILCSLGEGCDLGGDLGS